MEKINEFMRIFCDLKLDFRKVGRRYYLVDDRYWKQKENIDRDIYYIGQFMGEYKERFRPSLELLRIISEHSDKKVFLNEKAEWLFQCGKRVFKENIEKSIISGGICLVQNSYDENLGYGKLDKKQLTPVLDRGDFLRRE